MNQKLLKYFNFTLFIFLFTLSHSLISQKLLSVNKIDHSEIQIDGDLSENAWSNAKVLPIGFEVEPANNKPSKRETFVYILYSSKAMFIAYHAFDEPKNLRASIRSRDQRGFWSDDVIVVHIDTFRDARNNVSLAVNPLGSQFDFLYENFGPRATFNTNYNINYESVGRITDDGYIVEMKIPFSELAFDDNTDQIWNMRFRRRYYSEGILHENSSQKIDRDNLCLICQTTDPFEFKDIEIEKRNEILPYIFSSFSGEKLNPSEKIKYGKSSNRFGLGLNFDLTKNSSLEVALNPDFSQVEADVSLIDINSPVSLQYPERRPFFNRGMDIVNFNQDIFYSRSISDPIFASKLLTQKKESRFFIMAALDKETRYIIGGEDKSVSGDLDESYSALIRYQKIENKSRIGFVSSNRIYRNKGFGSLFGLDGLIDIGKTWRVLFELFKNYNLEPISNSIDNEDNRYGRTLNLDGERFQGHSAFFTVSRNTEHFKNVLEYREMSPNHQSDLGIITRNNQKHISFTNTYNNIINRKFVREFEFSTDLDIRRNFSNQLNLISINFAGEASLYGNSSIAYNYDLDTFYNYLGYDFKNLGLHELNFRTSPNELINFRAEFEWGKDLSYNESIPEPGNLISTSFSLRFQLSNNLSMTPSYRSSRLKKSIDENYFNGSITRLRLNYQFNNFLNIRLIAENNTFNERFFVQPLIQWNPNPSTIFYFGGNQRTVVFEDNEFSRPELLDFNRSQFFLKFQYLIGI